MNIPSNPYPYIIAAYAIAFVTIFGYAFFIRSQKKIGKIR